jgi:hypothetical protein
VTGVLAVARLCGNWSAMQTLTEKDGHRHLNRWLALPKLPDIT